jgi:hypothetical protein
MRLHERLRAPSRRSLMDIFNNPPQRLSSDAKDSAQLASQYSHIGGLNMALICHKVGALVPHCW